MPIIYDPTGEPIEIAEGRGDLRFSSMAAGLWPGGGLQLGLIGPGRTISYGNLFASQIWVAAAVMRMLTWSVRVPLKTYRRTGDDSRERDTESPLARGIIDPWERGASSQLVMHLLGSKLIHGNGLTAVDNGARNVIRFDPLDWRNAQPINPFQDRISGWTYRRDQGEETYSADKVIHTAWWSPLGPAQDSVGISPLAQLGTTISIEEAAQRYQQGYLKNNARPESQVVAPEGVAIDKTVRDWLREQIERIYTGAANAGRPLLLPMGLKWETVGHTAHEAELIEQRKVAREEIAAVYQIPPPMLGILDQATYSNIETQRQMAYTDALGPPLVLIEQLINAQLVRGLLRDQERYVEFDFGKVLRGDRLKEIQALREGIGWGIYSPNDARRALNQPASDAPGADDLWMPANNLRPLGQDSAPPEPSHQPPGLNQPQPEEVPA